MTSNFVILAPLAALAAHFAARVWSFIYFIPNALDSDV
jgi:hypothetical protein